MTSHCRRAVSILLLAALAAVVVAACEREQREARAEPVAEVAPLSITLSNLYPGQPPSPPEPSPQRAEYENNAYHVSEGKRLYEWFNCSGCHAHGGGDIGPPLIDDQWIYGSEIENIYTTVVQGRPNGMPSFRNKIPEQQVWQIAAYVRAMSGQLRKDVASGRRDSMYTGPSEQRTPQMDNRDSALPPSVQGMR
jgi:cytochrome c oxidase cbb3-type subunit III